MQSSSISLAISVQSLAVEKKKYNSKLVPRRSRHRNAYTNQSLARKKTALAGYSEVSNHLPT